MNRRDDDVEYQPARGWRLDKTVPVVLVIVLLSQAAAGIWFAGRTVQRQDDNERRIVQIESQHVGERISTLEVQLVDMKSGIYRIDGKMDRIIDMRGAEPAHKNGVQ